MKKQILFLLLSSAIIVNSIYAQQTLSSGWSKESNTANARLGQISGEAGDLNGDGYNDMYQTSQGKIHVYYGTSSGFMSAPDLIIEESGIKYLTITHGDLNKDGKQDLITADYQLNTFRIFYGKTGGLSATADYIYADPDASGYFGFSMDANGDINNDGYADLIVGQPSYNRGSGLYGKVKIFKGFPGGISASPVQTLTTIIGTLGFGTDVVYAGDVNNDSYDDVLISSQRVSAVLLLSSERIDLYLGSSTGNILATSWHDLGHVYSVGKGFDLNGDNYDDVVVTYYDNLHSKHIGWIYMGKSTGLDSDNLYSNLAGYAGIISGIGDFNNDSYADIVINDPFYDEGSLINQGKFDIYVGGPSGISSTPRFTFKSGVANATISLVNYGGDLNNDGFSDVLLGWPNYKSPETDEGRVLLFFGKTDLISNFTANKTKDCLSGNSFVFTNQALNGAISYLWDFGDGTTSTSPNPVHNYTAGGVYKVSLEVKNAKGYIATKTVSNYITVKAPAPSGTYTMGGTSPDLASVAELNSLIECGIAGDVTIRIRNGKYADYINIKNVDNSPYKLTIESEAQDPSKVRVIAFIINNSKNIYINGVSVYDSIHILGPWPEATVEIKNSHNITINNCKLYRPYYYSASHYINVLNGSGLVVKKTYMDYVPDSTKTGSCSGMYFYNCSDISIDSSVITVPNQFGGTGITVRKSSNLTVNASVIRGRGTIRPIGIIVDTVQGVRITNNVLYKVKEALTITNSSGTPLLNLIANNSIGFDIGNISGSTVQIYKSYDFKLFNNTIVSNYSDYALMIYYSDRLEIKNNIIKAASGKQCISIYPGVYEPDFDFELDYNFYIGAISNVNGDITSLYNWRRLRKRDVNSFQDTMSFESTAKFKPTTNIEKINEAGFVQPGVDKDIIGALRGPISSDIGAYNVEGDTAHYALYKNLNLFEISSDTFEIGNNTVTVKFTNPKPITINTVHLSYKINDGNVVTETWNGTLNYQDTVSFTFNTLYNVPRGRIYFTECRAVLDPNEEDTDTTNNSIKKNIYAKLEGAYTVYGTNPDFINIREANYHLVNSGLKNKVVFMIRSGVYSDTLMLQTGPVEYRSETGNTGDVTIHLNPARNISNSVVKSMTLLNLEDFNNAGYPYLGTEIWNCSNILFDSCEFVTPAMHPYPISRHGISVEPNSKNIKFYNCVFRNKKVGVTFNEYDQWYGSSYVFGKMEVKGCLFDHVDYPVVISAKLSDDTSNSINIYNNVMKNPIKGIMAKGYKGPNSSVNIHDNVIDSCTEHGIYIYDVYNIASGYNIYNNKINSISNEGIYIYYATKSSIYNNMITVKGIHGSIGFFVPNIGIYYYSSGIRLSNVDNIKVYNNSVMGGLIVDYNSTNNIQIYNNSFCTDSSISCYISIDSYSGSNNNFYRKDGKHVILVKVNNDLNLSIPYISLDTLNSFSKEKMSISVDPMYISNTDLHSTNGALQGRGRAFGSLLKDFDGDNRNTAHPSIGADENTFAPLFTRPTILSTYPINGRLDFPLDSDLVVKFDREISLNEGTISIYDFDEDTLVQTISFPSANVVLTDTNEVTIKLVATLYGGTRYYVNISYDAVYKDGMGNDPAGGKAAFNFTTEQGPPVLKTLYVNSITTDGAAVRTKIISNGGATLTQNGICWSTTNDPDLSYFKMTGSYDTVGVHDFVLSGLLPNTDYFVRAFAINQVDTTYGEILNFHTSPLIISAVVPYGNKEIHIQLYPNPFTSELSVDLSVKNVTVEIYNNLGILYHKQKLREGISVIPLAHLSDGLYSVRMIKDGKIIFNEEIVKQ